MDEILEAPAKVSVPEGTKPPESIEPPAPLLKPFFISPAEMHDAAVLLALGNRPMEEEMEVIAAYYEEQRKNIENFYAPRTEVLRDSVDTRLRLLMDKRDERAKLKLELDDAQKQSEEVTFKIREARVKRQLAWQRILKERFERVRGFFREREQKIVGELNQGRAEIMNDADKQIDYMNKFYRLVLNNRRDHAEGVSDRARHCEERRQDIKRQLDEAQKEVGLLREIGVTDFSATILLTFGLLALAGSGGAAASLLSDRQPGNSLFAMMLENLFRALDGLAPPWNSVTKFLVILIAPVAGVLLLFAVFAAFVWVAMKVAGPYSETAARARSRRGRGDEDEWAGSPVIKYIKALTSQFPSMEDFSADRQTYGRMLSYFPYLMLVVICLFLFTGVAVEDNKVNLTVMVTGMALALLSATSTLLYVTYIIQPRWRAAAESYQSQKLTDGFFFRYVRLNGEFFGLLVLLVVALLAAAFLPAVFPKNAERGISYFEDGQYKHIAWGMVTIFMLLASFGLSYGVIQKGIFENVRELLRKHKVFQNCVERYSYPPLIEDMLNQLKPGDQPGIEDTLDTFLKRLDSLEESSLNYELSQIFSPEEAALVASKARQWRWVPRWVRRFMRRLMVKERGEADEARVPPESEPLMSLRPIDYLDSEEAVGMYEVGEIELADALQLSTSLTEKIAELRRLLTSLDSEIKSLLSDIEARKAELAGVEERKVVTMSEVNSNFRQDEVGFKKAFRIGQQFKISQQSNRAPVEG